MFYFSAGVILETPDSVRRFAIALKRQEHHRERDQLFDDEDFDLSVHGYKLKEYNVKIGAGLTSFKNLSARG